MYYKFILPNDSFKSEYENFHFHRDMVYTISHVFNDNGKMRVFIKDKNGLDIEFKEGSFNATAKTATAIEARQNKSRLDFFWDNCQTSFVLNTSYHYNFETTEFFDLDNRSHFCGSGMEGVIAKISRHKKEMVDGRWRHLKVEGSEANFYSKQDFYDYFKKIDVENMKINGMFGEPQTAIDHLYFIARLPQYNENLLTLPNVVNETNINWFIQKEKFSFEKFLDIVAEVIFDEEDLSNENKKIVHNIIEAYELLPKSYGPTSVAKLIMGKEKKKNQNVEHLSGTCTTIKQPQVFTLADVIETYMYLNDIFVTKEEYSSGEEWRGNFEFIGSKMINLDKLKELKSKLK